MSAGTDLDPLFLSFQQALAGRYSIDRELGRGGMGVVYLAREVHLDRPVAIKLLPPERARDPAVRERFLREARLAAKLSHPNIIPIHAVDESGEFVYYVMAYIDGETLAQRVRTRGPLASSEAARVLREVSWALSTAHAQGLIHRDVKPDNILLEFGSGRVLVSDFGIAAALTEETARVSGTPEFMSPEQALGKTVDARSDLYSLGITAYYALTGRLPFEGKDATEVLAKQVTAAPPTLASTGMPVARKLSVLIERCVAKDPAQRPASADALAEQLTVALQQKRELPAALRQFVKRSSRLNGGGTLLAMMGAGITLVPAVEFGLLPVWAATWMGGTFWYFARNASTLVRLGFTHADIGPAFGAESEQTREELTAVSGAGRARVETLLLRLVQITGASSVLGALAGMSGFLFPLDRVVDAAAMILFSIGGLGFTPSLLAYLAVAERRRDVDTEFWGKVWRGPIGKAAFWVAKKFIGKKAPLISVTHRATELSLGIAAESLFDKLPSASRRQLRDLPELVERLQRDAQELRKVYNDLQDGMSTVDIGSEGYELLRVERDRVHAKLTDVVGALETIRLNLLRLHAGSGSVEHLTLDLGLASEMTKEVEHLLAGHAEIERALMFPRQTAPTPA